jgi:hypothetical protein
VSLPSARSAETANERDPSRREGRLSELSVPELLARAYRVAFSGSLLLEPIDVAPSNVRFVSGAVVAADGPWKAAELEWDVLGGLLPPDTLEFATRHARQYGLNPFAAVESLMLLPGESIASARQALIIRGVQALCDLSGDVRFAFVAPDELPEETVAPTAIEPLGLLAACFLVDSQRERAARSVARFEYAPLVIDGERARRVLATLNGPVRAVLESVIQSPSSVQSLRERNVVPQAELVSAVCALWITREITIGGAARPSVSPAATSDGPPSSSSMPPFAPASSKMPPPRKSSGFVRAQRADENRSAKEHAMELKVEEAWMRAETDPSRAQQITSVVVKAISVFPKNPRLRYYLARLHIQASRVDEAVKELERVLELDPTDAQAESELARLLTKKLG